jgi:hypothetical protein
MASGVQRILFETQICQGVLMMEAAHTSETSIDNYFTRQYIPEDKSELQTRSRENLKSHLFETIFKY